MDLSVSVLYSANYWCLVEAPASVDAVFCGFFGSKYPENEICLSVLSQGESGLPWWEASSRVIVSGVICGSCRDSAACGAGYPKSISATFPIAPNQPSIDARYGVLEGVSGTTVSDVGGIDSVAGEKGRKPNHI